MPESISVGPFEALSEAYRRKNIKKQMNKIRAMSGKRRKKSGSDSGSEKNEKIKIKTELKTRLKSRQEKRKEKAKSNLAPIERFKQSRKSSIKKTRKIKIRRENGNVFLTE